MAWKHSKWDKAKGVQVARLCANPDPKHRGEDWPRVAVLDMSAQEFAEFDNDPLKFAQKYSLYPEQPIQWMSTCAKPPLGIGVPEAAPGTRWTVTILHAKVSMATCAATPQEFVLPQGENVSEDA